MTIVPLNLPRVDRYMIIKDPLAMLFAGTKKCTSSTSVGLGLRGLPSKHMTLEQYWVNGSYFHRARRKWTSIAPTLV